MFIIAGLGNPGEKYQKTRHNMGFETIDILAEEMGICVDTKKHKALCGVGLIGTQKVVLAKPQTFMNASGESIRALVDFYKIDPETNLIIIYDDISLAPGRLRIRAKGSAGGHNGIKSIIAHLGTEKFARIKIGVGEKPERMDLADYVLGHYTGQDAKEIEEAWHTAASAAAFIVARGVTEAMNHFNGK